MTIYKIENSLFEKFPDFRRVVVIGTGLDNSPGEPGTAPLLAEAVARVNPSPTAEDEARIQVWDDAYRNFGADPHRYTPSIRFLRQQILRGKPPRSISRIVDLFNIVSLNRTISCGGDDLQSLAGGDLRLGFASGTETFSPLFKPSIQERPDPGEVIYYTPQTGRVLCRRWTWRNSDFSKITPQTRDVAVNLDFMVPPFQEADLAAAADELGALITQSCGGT